MNRTAYSVSLLAVVVLMVLAWQASSADPPAIELGPEAKTQLYVRTLPPGAKIILDGKPQGISPHLLVVPPGVGRMTVEVELDGHAKQARVVEIRGGRITRVEFKFDERPAVTAPGSPQSTLTVPTGGAASSKQQVEAAAKRFLAALVARDVAKMQRLIVETPPRWTAAAMPRVVKEVRDEAFFHVPHLLTEIRQTLVQDDWAAVRIDGPSGPQGKYLWLVLRRGHDGWRACYMDDSDPKSTLHKWFQEFISKHGDKQQGVSVTKAVDIGYQEADAAVVPAISSRSRPAPPELKPADREKVRRSMLNVLKKGISGQSQPAPELKPADLEPARQRARRTQSANHLRQIGMALQLYRAKFNCFPAAASYSKDGKPLLSWRVHILPFVGEDTLYKEFHLNEPWDSPHNKTLIATMPTIYGAPGSSVIKKGKTSYLAVLGKNTVFSSKQKQKARVVQMRKGFPVIIEPSREGTPRVMVIEASDKQAVVWSKPEDFHYDQKQPDPTAGLPGLRKDGVLVLFSDGSVDLVAVKLLRRLLQGTAAKATGKAVTTPLPSSGRAGPTEPIRHGGVDVLAPVVVETVPRSGDTNVDPSIPEIRVTFSKRMLDGSWSWSQLSDESFPKMTGKVRYLQDKRTCVLPVRLEPGKAYAIWLNSAKFGNFKDTQGRSAVPYLLIFETRQ